MNLSELVSPNRISKGLWWQRALALVGGCSPVSEACANCWSASQAHMRSHQKSAAMRKRYGGLTTPDGKWNGQIRLLEENLSLPLKAKKLTLWSVWNDLFHPDVPFDFITDAFSEMVFCDHHFFLILTKRPERMLEYHKAKGDWNPLAASNIGLGVTVELPKYLHRIETLLQIPAALHFASLEPLLGELSIKPFLTGWSGKNSGLPHRLSEELETLPDINKLDWVIIGCESGHRRRPMEARWAELLIRECKRADVPVFFKQTTVLNKIIHAPASHLLQFPNVEGAGR